MKVIFSHKDKILSAVTVPDDAVVTPEKCAKNNDLPVDEIDIHYGELQDEELDTVKKLKFNYSHIMKKNKPITQKERKETIVAKREKELKQDGKLRKKIKST